jgi:hypothetical protein
MQTGQPYSLERTPPSNFIRHMNRQIEQLAQPLFEPSPSIPNRAYETGVSSQDSIIETVTTRRESEVEMPVLRDVYVSRTLHSIPGVPAVTRQVVSARLVLPSMQGSGLVRQHLTDSRELIYSDSVGQGATDLSRAGSHESSRMQISSPDRQRSTHSGELIYSYSVGQGATDSSRMQNPGLVRQNSIESRDMIYSGSVGQGETDSSRDNFYCRECDKSYPGKRQYARHLLKHKQPNKFNCSVDGCKKTDYRYPYPFLTILELMLCALM